MPDLAFSSDVVARAARTSALRCHCQWRLISLGLLGLALAARLLHLTRESLWFDEILTARLAVQSPALMTSELLTWNLRPPLHYFVAWAALRLFGSQGTEFALRLPSVLAGVLSVALMVTVARRLWAGPSGTTVGLIAAGMLALAPFQVQFSQEARSYALLLMWALLAGWGMLARWDAAPGRRTAGIAAWLGGATAALYTHYTALLPLAGLVALGAYRALTPRRPWPSRLIDLLWLALPLLLFLLWPAHRQFSAMTGEAISTANLAEPRLLSLSFLADASYVLGAGQMSPWRALFGFLAILGFLALTVRREWRPLSFLAGWALPMVAAVAIIPGKPIPDRYLMTWSPVFFLLAARGLEDLARAGSAVARKPNIHGPTAFALGLGCCLTLTPGLRAYYETHKEDWRGLAQWVAAAAPAPIHAPWITEVATFYLPQPPDPARPVLDLRTPEAIHNSLTAAPRSWVVSAYQGAAFDPDDTLAEAWRALNHVELTLWGNLSLVYVGPQAEPHELVDELMRMKVTATAPTWVSLARAARLAGESDAAALALQAATALAQADADPHYLRDAAQEWRELGQPEVALPLYRMAGRRLPADPETLLGWGVSANAIGAADEVLRVLDTLPASEAHKYWPERLRGDAYRQKGQWEAAIAYYLAAETAQPGESAIAALLAMALDQAGDTTQAVLWWQQYLAREPVGPFKEQACRYLIEHGALPCIR